MKLLKSFLILFIAISITSCSSDDDNSFELSAANLAGTFKITAYTSVETESATSSAGVTTELSKNTIVGDTFTNMVVTLNTGGTFTAKGSFRVNSTVTPTPEDGQKDAEIVTLDSEGTYSLNLTSKTISLIDTSGDGYVNGTFEIKTFNVDKLIIKKETDVTTGGITNNIVTDITLERN